MAERLGRALQKLLHQFESGTGGAGFIGSHLVRLFVNKYPNYNIFNLDKLTYAGNLENLKDIDDAPNYYFIKSDMLLIKRK